MSNADIGFRDQIVVQCIQQCPRGQLQYHYQDPESVIAFCRNRSRTHLERHRYDSKNKSSFLEPHNPRVTAEPEVKPGNPYEDHGRSRFDISTDDLSSKLTRQQFRNNVDLHRITCSYEDDANDMLLEKIAEFNSHEKKQAEILNSQFKLIELQSEQKRSADQDYFERKIQKNASSAEEYKKQFAANEKLRAANLEQKLEDARKLEKEKERLKKEKLAAAKKKLLALIELQEQDTKLYQEAMKRISKADLTDMSGDECFPLYLQIAKQSYDNMCLIMMKAQTKMVEVSDADCALASKYSQELKKALQNLKNILDAEEKGQSSVSSEIVQPTVHKPSSSNIPSQPEQVKDVRKEMTANQAIQMVENANTPRPPNLTVADPKPNVPPNQRRLSEQQTKAISSNVENPYKFYKKQSSHLFEMVYQSEKLKEDPRMKQFLKTVKGACRSLNNAISGNSLKLLVYQKERILSLFQGSTVTISDVVIDPSAVQNGPKIIKVLLAQNFIRSLTRFDCRELSLAILLVELASLDVEFKAALMTSFHLLCPFTRPAYLVKKSNQSEDDFKAELGYTKQLGEWEDPKTYLNRMLYATQLYAAVLTSRPISTNISQHPFGFSMAWQWVAEFVNLAPFSGYSAGLLRSFLTVCGRDLLHQYGRQFKKLMQLVLSQYVKKCRDIADDLTYVGHLENSLQTFFSTGTFFQDCALENDFWLL